MIITCKCFADKLLYKKKRNLKPHEQIWKNMQFMENGIGLRCFFCDEAYFINSTDIREYGSKSEICDTEVSRQSEQGFNVDRQSSERPSNTTTSEGSS